MKKNVNKKKLAAGVTGVAVVALSAATFAWFTSEDGVVNKFKTGGIPEDSVKIWEIFDEPDEWLPGQDVEKKVGVVNNGKGDVVVRLAYKEAIQKLMADAENDGKLAKKYLSDKSEATKMDIQIPSTDYTQAELGYKSLDELGLTLEGDALPDGVTVYGKEVATGKEGTKKFVFVINEAVQGEEGTEFYLIDADISMNEDGSAVVVKSPKYVYYTQNVLVEKDWTKAPTPTDANTSALDNLLHYTYSADFSGTTPEVGKWVYDSAKGQGGGEEETPKGEKSDGGWFYYMDVLKSGSKTPALLEAVTLDQSADNTYQFMEYALEVHIEALQATKAAVEDAFNPVNQSIKDTLLSTMSE